MDTGLNARFFVPSDAEALTGLLNSAYADLESAGLNFTAATQDVETTLRRVSHGVCWVVEDQGELAATLTLVIPPGEEIQSLTAEARVDKRAWIEQVAVGARLRGRRVAQQLYHEAVEWSKGNGYTSLGLDTAVPAEHLVRMYEKWGFRRTGTVHFDGKNYDSAVLIRPLGESIS